MFDNQLVGFFLVLPAVLFITAGFLVPIAILLSESFVSADGGFGIESYVAFFAEPRNQVVFGGPCAWVRSSP